MKKIFLALFIAFAACANAQEATLVSFNGIGAIKLGMKKAEAEKLLGVPLTLKHIGIDYALEDTFRVRYQGRDLIIYMKPDYDDSSAVAVVSKVHTMNSSFRTGDGIGIGSERLKIIAAMYPYTIHVGPDFEDADYTIRSKTRSTMIVTNEEDTHVMIFRLNNKKVVSIEVNDYHDWY